MRWLLVVAGCCAPAFAWFSTVDVSSQDSKIDPVPEAKWEQEKKAWEQEKKMMEQTHRVALLEAQLVAVKDAATKEIAALKEGMAKDKEIITKEVMANREALELKNSLLEQRLAQFEERSRSLTSSVGAPGSVNWNGDAVGTSASSGEQGRRLSETATDTGGIEFTPEGGLDAGVTTPTMYIDPAGSMYINAVQLYLNGDNMLSYRAQVGGHTTVFGGAGDCIGNDNAPLALTDSDTLEACKQHCIATPGANYYVFWSGDGNNCYCKSACELLSSDTTAQAYVIPLRTSINTHQNQIATVQASIATYVLGGHTTVFGGTGDCINNDIGSAVMLTDSDTLEACKQHCIATPGANYYVFWSGDGIHGNNCYCKSTCESLLSSATTAQAYVIPLRTSINTHQNQINTLQNQALSYFHFPVSWGTGDCGGNGVGNPDVMYFDDFGDSMYSKYMCKQYCLNQAEATHYVFWDPANEANTDNRRNCYCKSACASGNGISTIQAYILRP